MNGCFLDFITIHEKPKTVLEFVGRFAHGEEVRSQVLLGHGNFTGFNKLTYFHRNCRKLVTSYTTEYTKEVFLQFTEIC